MDEAGSSIEESDSGPFYDSDFEQSDFEDGSLTASKRGFVVDEELEDSDPNNVELKFCLTNYAVSNGYPICITKSSSLRVQAKCGFDNKGKRCPFKLWASWIGSDHSFQVKGLCEDHTCVREYRHASLVNPDWIAKQFMKHLCDRPKMKAREMREEVKKNYMPNGPCFPNDLLPGCSLLDSHEDSITVTRCMDLYGIDIPPPMVACYNQPKYGDLLRETPLKYGDLLKETQPEYDDLLRKSRLKYGDLLKETHFKVIDSYWLGWEQSSVPLAWAMVNVENKRNWHWFLQLLVDDLVLGDGDGLTIISDHHKGLVEAAKEILPSVEHRRCASINVNHCGIFWASMNYTYHQPQNFISEWFTKKKFAETYIGNIRPLNGSNMWAREPYTKPLPPIVRRMPGRPKIRRRSYVIKEDKGGYKRIRVTGRNKNCTNCWQQGHNKRTCKNPTTTQPTQLRKKMGRPRTRYMEESTTSQPTQTTRNPAPKETGKKTGQEKMDTGGRGKEKMDTGGRGKKKMDTWVDHMEKSVNEEGLQDIPVIIDFKDHKHAADMLLSGYSEDTCEF
ncbi:hypothetical protein LXL04_007230 [Taraxacum kok-saghyz]